MDNHLHVLVRLGPEVATGWSDEEVVRRWGRLFPPRDRSCRASRPAPRAQPGRMPSTLTLARSPRRDLIRHRAGDSPRALDEERSRDAGRCAKSASFCRKAALGNDEITPSAVWDRLNGGFTPEPAVPNTGLPVLSRRDRHRSPTAERERLTALGLDGGAPAGCGQVSRENSQGLRLM